MKSSIVQNRTFQFSLKIIELYIVLNNNKEFLISKQLLRSATSIGANVEEALGSSSKKDFIAKMTIARKECRETHYWLRLLSESKLVDLDLSGEIDEANQILLILYGIINSARKNLGLTKDDL